MRNVNLEEEKPPRDWQVDSAHTRYTRDTVGLYVIRLYASQLVLISPVDPLRVGGLVDHQAVGVLLLHRRISLHLGVRHRCSVLRSYGVRPRGGRLRVRLPRKALSVCQRSSRGEGNGVTISIEFPHTQ